MDTYVGQVNIMEDLPGVVDVPKANRCLARRGAPPLHQRLEPCVPVPVPPEPSRILALLRDYTRKSPPKLRLQRGERCGEGPRARATAKESGPGKRTEKLEEIL